jgi:hypothetical protein
MARRSEDHALWRHNHTFYHQRTGSYYRTLSDHGSIHDNGSHADQHAILNGAPVKYGSMANGHLVADDQRMDIVGDMEDTEVLHVSPLTDSDEVHVPPNDSVKPNAAVLTQHDIANDDAGLFDKTGGRNGGRDSLKRADHAMHSRGIDPDLQEVGVVPEAEPLMSIADEITASVFVRSCATTPDGFGIRQ